MFTLKPSEISEVVISPAGFHIIQILKIFPGNPNVTWLELKSELVSSVATNPVNKLDIQRWLRKMEEKYPIKQSFRE